MAKPINEVHDLINKVQGFKALITEGKVQNGQNLRGPIDNIKKDLKPVLFSLPVDRARGILNLESRLQILLNAKGQSIANKQERIRKILEIAKATIFPLHNA
jgi:hypothetical protein